MNALANDNNAYRFPVSIKGIVVRDDTVILVRNSRNEWELPGGKLELDETPAKCLAREIHEELDLDVEPLGIIDSWTYSISPDVNVLVVAYGCSEISRRVPVLSDEHSEMRWFPLGEIDGLNMPADYKRVIALSDASLHAAESALRRAQLGSDVAALDKLIDGSLMFTGPDGAVYGKQDDLDAHRNGAIRITRLEPSEERVQRHGAIAVVSVRMEMAGTFQGTPFAGPFRYTRIWRAGAGGWRIVAGHVSSVQA